MGNRLHGEGGHQTAVRASNAVDRHDVAPNRQRHHRAVLAAHAEAGGLRVEGGQGRGNERRVERVRVERLRVTRSPRTHQRIQLHGHERLQQVAQTPQTEHAVVAHRRQRQQHAVLHQLHAFSQPPSPHLPHHRVHVALLRQVAHAHHRAVHQTPHAQPPAAQRADHQLLVRGVETSTCDGLVRHDHAVRVVLDQSVPQRQIALLVRRLEITKNGGQHLRGERVVRGEEDRLLKRGDRNGRHGVHLQHVECVLLRHGELAVSWDDHDHNVLLYRLARVRLHVVILE